MRDYIFLFKISTDILFHRLTEFEYLLTKIQILKLRGEMRRYA